MDKKKKKKKKKKKVLGRRIQGRRLVYSFIISVLLVFVPMNIQPSELVLTSGQNLSAKRKKIIIMGQRNQLTGQQKQNQE